MPISAIFFLGGGGGANSEDIRVWFFCMRERFCVQKVGGTFIIVGEFDVYQSSSRGNVKNNRCLVTFG